MLVRFMRRPSLVAGLYLAGALGAVLGANASALLIYTGYPWDTCGSLLTLVFVVLPAFWCFAARGPALSSAESDRELERNLMRRLTVGLVSLLVLALAGGGVWAVHCHFRNLRIAEWVAARPDPLADIHANGYRYVAFFNRMSDASQERILEKLKDSGEPGVFCFAAGMGRLEIFRPEVAVVADGNLYLVCRFNEGWQPPAQFFDQGARNSYVHVVRDADEVLGRWPFQMDRGTAGFHRINDRFWENRYRMLCLPCGAGFQPRASVGVGCFTIVGETSKGWELESVAEGTLTLPAPLPQARAEDSGRADTCAP